MSGIFDEERMLESLKKYLPGGETLTAGIHGIGAETEIKQVFGKCRLVEDILVPDENGGVLEVSKSKYSKHDVYIGITQHCLIVSECETYKHLYEFNDNPDLRGVSVQTITARLPIAEIGTCFLFTEIQKCIIKNAWMGAVNCLLTMKNGTSLSLILPKRGGMGGGMPHHAEYREAIIKCLSSYSG